MKLIGSKCRRRAGGGGGGGGGGGVGQGLSRQGRPQRTPGLPGLPPQRRSPIQGRQPCVAQRSRRGTPFEHDGFTPRQGFPALMNDTRREPPRHSIPGWCGERGLKGRRPAGRGDPPGVRTDTKSHAPQDLWLSAPRALTAPASPAGAATAKHAAFQPIPPPPHRQTAPTPPQMAPPELSIQRRECVREKKMWYHSPADDETGHG